MNIQVYFKISAPVVVFGGHLRWRKWWPIIQIQEYFKIPAPAATCRRHPRSSTVAELVIDNTHTSLFREFQFPPSSSSVATYSCKTGGPLCAYMFILRSRSAASASSLVNCNCETGGRWRKDKFILRSQPPPSSSAATYSCKPGERSRKYTFILRFHPPLSPSRPTTVVKLATDKAHTSIFKSAVPAVVVFGGHLQLRVWWPITHIQVYLEISGPSSSSVVT